MSYHLKNLDAKERETILSSPIWVTLLIACADYDIEEQEIDRAKEIIHIKSFAEQNDVKELYQELDSNVDEKIDAVLKDLHAGGKERLTQLEEALSQLNNILPKLDKTYALQLYQSLRNLAIHVAQADGGWFGIDKIGDAEKSFIKLPMIERP